MSVLHPLLILCARDKSWHTHGSESWAQIIRVQERRQFSLPHALPACCQWPVHLSKPRSLHHCFNFGGTDVLLRKVTHWSVSVLVRWQILYVRKVHRKERQCTLIQRSLFQWALQAPYRNTIPFTSLDKQGNWGKDKDWCLMKSHPVSRGDRNKESLLRRKIPSLRQASLLNTNHLAVSNYNTPDLLSWQPGF